MPVIRYGENSFPKSSELEYYEFLRIKSDTFVRYNQKSAREIIFTISGSGYLNFTDNRLRLEKSDTVLLPDGYGSWMYRASTATQLIRVGGRWKNPSGTYGIFQIGKSQNPINHGDPNPFERNTEFDCHFHDCDEYWIIIEGKGLVVSEGVRYRVQAGDCVITRAGEHHDFPIVYESILAVWFEGSMVGKKRPGHLYCEK